MKIGDKLNGGTIVEIFDEGYAVSRKNKKEENYPHHKTEYVTFVRKTDER